jgi:hypothetical protein
MRIALYDNVKSLRLSVASLEALITADRVSGRQLHVGEGQRPNRLVWAMTFNSPSLGSDLARRAVPVRVRRPVYDPDWAERCSAHIEANRWAILGDLVAALRRPPELPPGLVFDTWPEWCKAVLGRVGDPAGLLALMAARRSGLNDDREQAEEAVEIIHEVLRDKFGVGADPDAMRVKIPAGILFEKVAKRMAPEIRTPHHGTKWLYALPIPQLVKSNGNTPYRGAVWTGRRCSPDAPVRYWDDID